MALGSFKIEGRGKGNPDVRGFSVPENKPKVREGFKLPEEDFGKIADDRLISVYGLQDAGQLKYLFPDKTAEIYERLRLTQEALRKDIEPIVMDCAGLKEHRPNFLAMVKLLDPEMDLQKLFSNPQEYYAKIIADGLNSAATFYFKALWSLKVLFPNFPLVDAEVIFKAGNDYLKELERNIQQIQHSAENVYAYFAYIDLAAYLKCLFPEKITTTDYRKHWEDLVKSMQIYKDSEIASWETYCHIAFQLTVLDADEVKIDETGLHLINHPAAESLETKIPEQPLEREI